MVAGLISPEALDRAVRNLEKSNRKYWAKQAVLANRPMWWALRQFWGLCDPPYLPPIHRRNNDSL